MAMSSSDIETTESTCQPITPGFTAGTKVRMDESKVPGTPPGPDPSVDKLSEASPKNSDGTYTYDDVVEMPDGTMVCNMHGAGGTFLEDHLGEVCTAFEALDMGQS